MEAAAMHANKHGQDFLCKLCVKNQISITEAAVSFYWCERAKKIILEWTAYSTAKRRRDEAVLFTSHRPTR